MFDYLQKFKALRPALRDVVSGEMATKAIAGLEAKYGIGLDALVIKIMVRDISWQAVPEVLEREHNLTADQAQALQADLAREVFSSVTRYLGIGALRPATPPSTTASTAPAPQRPAARPQPIADDAAELQAMRKKATAVEAAGTVPAAAAVPADTVRNAAGITADGDEARRLERISQTFHKGIRDAIDTKQALKKPLAEGGLGLDEAKAAAVMSILRREKPAQPATAPVTRPVLKTGLDTLRDVEYAFPVTPAKPAETFHEFTAAELEHELLAPVSAPSAPAAATAPAAAPAFRISAADVDRARRELERPAPVPAKEKQAIAVRVQRTQPQDDRPRVNDVTRPEKRTKGPLDELATMDAVSFRRLGEEAVASAVKLEQMISIIGQEGVHRRQEAVAAWRKSPLHLQYVRLGQRSFAETRPVEEIIAEEQKNQGAAVLTPAEFNAILDLNGKLRV